MSETQASREAARIRSAYANRSQIYAPFERWVLAIRQERERGFSRWIREDLRGDVRNLRLVELGCGTGANLADFLRLGFEPENLCGIDLIDRRIVEARRRLPPAVRLLSGDAAELDFGEASFDVVFQSMMCTSILDDGMLSRVVARMWQMAAPGGGVLWYDFCYDNPRNPDVRGIPLRRVRALFPTRIHRIHRLTLAPPLSRIVTRVHPVLYPVFNCLPFLRTHVLCWIPKPAS